MEAVSTEKESPVTEGERKYVTVLFSDLTGYTEMSEKLDPEEVKEITGRIFGDISKIVNEYDGFIEKYIGDAVMALFGVPQAHEDDPVRAIRVARNIHDLVDAMSPEVEKRIGRGISMHTGINTHRGITFSATAHSTAVRIATDSLEWFPASSIPDQYSGPSLPYLAITVFWLSSQ